MSAPSLPFLSFLSGAVALGNAPVLIDDQSESWLRYGELRERIQNLLPFFTIDLATPRGLVLCALPCTINGVVAYLSAAASGNPLLLIDTGAPRPDLFIAAYEPEWIILPTALRPSEDYTPVEWPLTDLFLWHRTTPTSVPLHPDLFLLLQPPSPPEAVKTVRLSYKNIVSNTQATVAALKIDTHTRPLLQMPLAYSFGLSLLHMALSTGGSLMLTEHDIKNRSLWDLAAKRDVTLFAGILFHFEYLARAGIDNLHVPRIKTFLQGGGKMTLERTQEILRQVTARRGELFILYGQTEASPRISVLPLHDRPDKIGSFGPAVEGGSFTTSGDSLLYHGPNVMMGYAETRADLAQGDTQRGTLLLPSPARVDEDGFLWIE